MTSNEEVVAAPSEIDGHDTRRGDTEDACKAVQDLLNRASTVLEELKQFELYIAKIGKSRRVETGRFRKGIETERVNLRKVRCRWCISSTDARFVSFEQYSNGT